MVEFKASLEGLEKVARQTPLPATVASRSERQKRVRELTANKPLPLTPPEAQSEAFLWSHWGKLSEDDTWSTQEAWKPDLGRADMPPPLRIRDKQCGNEVASRPGSKNLESMPPPPPGQYRQIRTKKAMDNDDSIGRQEATRRVVRFNAVMGVSPLGQPARDSRGPVHETRPTTTQRMLREKRSCFELGKQPSGAPSGRYPLRKQRSLVIESETWPSYDRHYGTAQDHEHGIALGARSACRILDDDQRVSSKMSKSLTGRNIDEGQQSNYQEAKCISPGKQSQGQLRRGKAMRRRPADLTKTARHTRHVSDIAQAKGQQSAAHQQYYPRATVPSPAFGPPDVGIHICDAHDPAQFTSNTAFLNPRPSPYPRHMSVWEVSSSDEDDGRGHHEVGAGARRTTAQELDEEAETEAEGRRWSDGSAPRAAMERTGEHVRNIATKLFTLSDATREGAKSRKKPDG